MQSVLIDSLLLALLIGLVFFFVSNRVLRRKVAERKQAVEALRASEERFRDFAETAADWFWEKDASFKFTFLSERFQESTGWNPERVLGCTLAECCATPKPDEEKWKAHFADLEARRSYKNFESNWVRRDGSVSVLSTSGKPIFDRQGRFRGYRGVGRDITQRRQIEESLRKVSRTIEQSPNMVFITDTAGKFEYVNSSFTRISGFSAEEAIGQSPRILKSGVNPPAVYQDLWETIRNGEIWRGELCNRKRSGELFWNFVSISPITDDSGKVTHFASIQIDSTERKRAEEALRESEARLRAIGDAVPDLVFVLDEDGRYIEVLTSQHHLLNANADALKGKLLHQVLPRNVAQHLLDVVSETLAKGQTQVVEYGLPASRSPSETRWFEARTASIETPGAAKPAVIFVARDITERKAAEEQLRQAQKMEAIGQLTGGIAHDFNNLLAIILGNLELLGERLSTQPSLQELVRPATEAADRGAILTQQLLAFSRRQPLQPRPVNLNALVLRMTELLKRTLGETIKIETLQARDLWQTLVDPTQLENALLNLALNARDAMPQGGTLTVETANSRLDERVAAANQDVRPGEYVMLAVGDTGTGMTPDVLKNAFQPFFTTKAVGKGTGLGLSMVYGLVKQSGGHVEISSEVGRGTTVRVYLPRTQRAPLADRGRHPSVRTEVPKGKTETILVVEDDPNVRQLAISMLASLGYRTLEAEEARTAMGILEKNPQIGLLFTDVVLPGGLSGGDLAREARVRFPRLKVLFTSGYTKHALVHRGRLDENVDIITKPYRKADLAKKLVQVFDAHRAP